MKKNQICTQQTHKTPGHKPELNHLQAPAPPGPGAWSTGVCPNCGFTQADIDPDGVLWCPACGYSKKGIFT